MNEPRPQDLRHVPEGFSAPTHVFHDDLPGPIGALIICLVLSGGGAAAALYCIIALGWGLWCLGAAAVFAVLCFCGGVYGLCVGYFRVLVCPEGFVEVSI